MPGEFAYAAYKDVCSFDLDDKIEYNAAQGSVTCTFLDMHIRLSFTEGLTILPVYKNAKYALTGDIQTLKKRSIQPPIGHFGRYLLKQQRAELKGRLARWHRINSSLVSKIYPLVCDILHFSRHGFSYNQVFSIFHNIMPCTDVQSLIDHLISIYQNCHTDTTPTRHSLEDQLRGQEFMLFVCCSVFGVTLESSLGTQPVATMEAHLQPFTKAINSIFGDMSYSW